VNVNNALELMMGKPAPQFWNQLASRAIEDRSVKAMRCALFSLILLTLGAGAIAAQQTTKSAVGSAVTPVTLPPVLARVLTDYEAGWKAGDAAALASLFAKDGFVLPDGQPPAQGWAAIRKLYTGSGSPLSLRAFAYAMCGDVGYIVGGFTSDRGQPDHGKFTLTLRKGADGRWLIMSDMDNANRRRE
jgi:ketosteroid isomerase-like protein